jgi:hypothetical protein
VLLVWQKPPTIPEHLSSNSMFSRVRVVQSLVLCVVFYQSLFLSFCSFFFWPLYCQSSDLYYGFSLPLRYLHTFLSRSIWFRVLINYRHVSYMKKVIYASFSRFGNQEFSIGALNCKTCAMCCSQKHIKMLHRNTYRYSANVLSGHTCSKPTNTCNSRGHTGSKPTNTCNSRGHTGSKPTNTCNSPG